MECCRNVRIFIHLPFSKYFRLNFLCVLSSNLTSFDTIFLNYIKNVNVIFKRKLLSWYGYLQLLLLRNLCHFYILFILCHSYISTALTLCKLDTSVPIWCIFYDLTDLRNIALSGSIGVYYWSTDLHKISLLKNPGLEFTNLISPTTFQIEFQSQLKVNWKSESQNQIHQYL